MTAKPPWKLTSLHGRRYSADHCNQGLPRMLLIRPEIPADAAAITALHAAAFPTAAEAELVMQLRTAGLARVSLVGQIDQSIVGHVLLSPVQLRGVCSAPGGLGLAPLAVAPAWQRQGIGGWLIIEALAAARRSAARFVVVLGDPAYYARFGFEAARSFGLTSAYGDGDEFRVRQLRSGALPAEGGLITYAPQFDAVSTTDHP